MAKLADASAERLADHFINYLFAEKADNRHVRRVASWVGLIVLGIEKLTGSRYVPRSRQLRFDTMAVVSRLNSTTVPERGVVLRSWK